MCFLPRQCTYYKQLPMEELTNEQYEEELQAIKKRKLNYQRYNWFDSDNEKVNDSNNYIYCDSEKCINC